ncbi:hypothetical protein MUA04_18675 [Enterobacteriaceae bacterium H11S18]|uniref:hypothetical protein n=1 Tax=Dryocola clanedunensis TaxID=2925396 RepID=UPI0022F09E97|nr:hypothetical protein [Dryocola clanedunensis]MCT4712197.1 hypothetical protein [Dryocola clanedunensis]
MNKRMLPLWSAAILLPGLVYSTPDEQRDELQPLNQHQRQKSQQQQVTAVAPCVRQPPDLTAPAKTFPFRDEQPCSAISQIRLSGTDDLPYWLQPFGNVEFIHGQRQSAHNY